MTRTKIILVLLLMCSALFSVGCVDEQLPAEEIAEQTQQKDDEFEFENLDDVEIEVIDCNDIEIPELTLDEAKDTAGFDILLPSYIPDGYEFDHALFSNNSATFEDEVFERVTLVYKSGDDWLHISEVFYETGSSDTSVMDGAETVSINGSEGKFVAFTQTNLLRWAKGDIELTITGMVDKDEIVKVAESVA